MEWADALRSAAGSVTATWDEAEASLEQSFDLVIIGGGITGAALAYSAVHARRPLKVALIERDQLASGTSSRSSGLLHGGLRYLAQGRLPLVRRLLRGRRAFARLAPHLVRRAPFVLPIQPMHHSPLFMRLGLALYGLCDRGLPLGGRGLLGTLARPVRLDGRQALVSEPLLGARAGTGAFAYDELTVDGARLVEALAGGAAHAGATVVTGALCEGLYVEKGRVAGIWLRDGGQRHRGSVLVKARVVVDATGPHSGHLEETLRGAPTGMRTRRPLRLSRGTHIVLSRERLPLTRTVVFFAADGRPLFASPRDKEILIGTTEQEHRGAPDDVAPTPADVRTLIDEVSAAFPAAGVDGSAIVRAFAGLRPLANPGSGDVGALDRGYMLEWPAPGLLAMRGGKLTLALSAAREALVSIDRDAKSLGLAPAGPLLEDRLPALQPTRTPIAQLSGGADPVRVGPSRSSSRRAA
jgi:glycerol-3-phosphate dehydrogenase